MITREISRRTFMGWSLAGTASLALAACGFGTSSSAVKGGSLSVGMKAILTDVNPISTKGYQWIQMMAHVLYDGLIRNDSTGKHQPHIALSWDQPTPLSTIIKVRQGVKFKTGDPVTAKDVAYSIAVRSDPALVAQTNSRPIMSGNQWGSAQVIDNYTVQINLKEKVDFLSNPAPVMVVPDQAFTRYSLNSPTVDVGSGPYELVNFTSGTSLKVKPNANYWNGVPKLDSITFHLFNDIATEALNLRSGQLDGLYDVPPLHLKDVNTVANKKTVADATYMDWWVAQIGKPPLNNPDVRKALRFCFNIDLLNQSSFSGAGVHSWNPFNFTPYKSDGIDATGVTYDPDKAKSMLAAAGASNISVPLLGIDSYEDSIIQGQIIQQGLQAAGVKSSFSAPPIADWIKATYGDATWEGLFFNAGNLPFPFTNLYDFAVDPAGLKSAYTGGKSPLQAVADLYGKVTTATPDQLAQMVKLAEQSIVDDCIAYWMFGGPVSMILPNNLNGVITNGGGDVFWEKAYFS